MDDFQVIIYIIIVVILFVSRVLKARKKAEQPGPPAPKRYEETEVYPDTNPKPYNTSPKPRQLTFEDLLKEFSGYENKEKELAPAKPDTYQIPPKAELRPEPQEYRSYESPDAFPTHEEEEARSLESLVSYEEMYHEPGMVSISDTKSVDINEDRFTEYESHLKIDIHKANRFKRLLRNSISIKDAVILKEILDRKYF